MLTKTAKKFAAIEQVLAVDIATKMSFLYDLHPFVDDDGKAINWSGMEVNDESLCVLHNANVVGKPDDESSAARVYMKAGEMMVDLAAMSLYCLRFGKNGTIELTHSQTIKALLRAKKVMGNKRNKDYFFNFHKKLSILFFVGLKMRFKISEVAGFKVKKESNPWQD